MVLIEFTILSFLCLYYSVAYVNLAFTMILGCVFKIIHFSVTN